MAYAKGARTTMIDYSITITDVPEQSPYCDVALTFLFWAEDVVGKAVQSGDQGVLDFALVQITKKYRDWRETVSKPHRYHIGERGHRCLFDVWDQGCTALRAAELALQRDAL